MLISTIFGLLLISIANGLRNCENCTKLNECPQAVQEVNNNHNEEVVKKLRDAQCGFKINCSDCNNINKEPEINNDDGIENHPNAHLLSDECGEIGGKREIRGKVSRSYPWLVFISYRRGVKLEYKCDGTLINTRYVLTAAHCIKGQDIAGVRTNKDYCYREQMVKKCESTLQDIAVSHKIIHPNYKRFPQIKNDIGLLRLQKTVDFSAGNAGTICLPVFQNLQEQDLSGEFGFVTGWGRSYLGKPYDMLLKDDILIHPMEICKEAFENRNMKQKRGLSFENTLCAGNLGATYCPGDAGGPLMFEGEYNNTYKTIQYGIVSYGLPCNSGKPTIFTDVRKYMKWILDTIEP